METGVDVNLPHHSKIGGCTTRAAYRQGRKLTAVKVYTISDESQHLLIYNVPAIRIGEEVLNLCQRFGEVLSSQQVMNVESIEKFTNVYHVHYATLKSSRFAKRNLDNRAFFGGILHVCYAPELESVEETKNKLITRRKEVSFHLKQQEFPKQFRNKGKYQGKKRRFQENSTNNTAVPFNNQGKKLKFEENSTKNTALSLNNYGGHFNQMNHFTLPDVQVPGPSEVKVEKKVTVDVKPFKSLIPTKVSRIIFHNKNNKVDDVK
ncbi:RNA-binding protein 48 [Halyomorpha halys]|uniref:RNA-binding protein 48 n=1 Tax=Halyomorpha halys TaxID=286706 RepID=UPI0006D51F47|nr:RNA-binding protein 48 [Halyomorpha halys]